MVKTKLKNTRNFNALAEDLAAVAVARNESHLLALPMVAFRATSHLAERRVETYALENSDKSLYGGRLRQQLNHLGRPEMEQPLRDMMACVLAGDIEGAWDQWAADVRRDYAAVSDNFSRLTEAVITYAQTQDEAKFTQLPVSILELTGYVPAQEVIDFSNGEKGGSYGAQIKLLLKKKQMENRKEPLRAFLKTLLAKGPEAAWDVWIDRARATDDVNLRAFLKKTEGQSIRYTLKS